MLYFCALLLNAPGPPVVTPDSSFWLNVTQTVIAGSLLAAVVGLYKAAAAINRWYYQNEQRWRDQEKARLRHRRELDHVGNFLEETHPGKFRRRLDDQIDG